MIKVHILEGGHSPMLELLGKATFCWLCGAVLVLEKERGKSVFLDPNRETEVYDTRCRGCGDLLVRHLVKLVGSRSVKDRGLERSSKLFMGRHDG